MILYVNEPGAVIGKSGGKFKVSKGDTNLANVPINTLESIVLYNGSNITSSCVNEVINKGINLTYVTQNGNYIAKLDSVPFYNVERQMLQFKRYNDEVFSLDISKKIIGAKIQNSKVMLKKMCKKRN